MVQRPFGELMQEENFFQSPIVSFDMADCLEKCKLMLLYIKKNRVFFNRILLFLINPEWNIEVYRIIYNLWWVISFVITFELMKYFLDNSINVSKMCRLY